MFIGFLVGVPIFRFMRGQWVLGSLVDHTQEIYVASGTSCRYFEHELSTRPECPQSAAYDLRTFLKAAKRRKRH
uniref:Putative secreted protein n=1 Tax=Ixodes ricinus TaxID=34613 RepID=A0A6B0U2W5_IXORI